MPSKNRLLVYLALLPGLLLSACGGGGGGGVGGGVNEKSAAPPPIFEDFLGGTIDAKWNTLSTLDCAISAATNELVTSQSYANQGGDCGVEFVNSANIASFSSEIKVTAFTETSGGPIRARLRGIFYNDGTIANGGAQSF